MKIFKRKKKKPIKINTNILISPISLYNNANYIETIMFHAFKYNYDNIMFYLKRAVKERMLDTGKCFLYNLDKYYAGFLITGYQFNDKIDEGKIKNIDYEFLYNSLKDLLNVCINKRLNKLAFCINDFLNINCDINILESMIKSIFNGYDITITFIYGE